jgi:hypothetical protein
MGFAALNPSYGGRERTNRSGFPENRENNREFSKIFREKCLLRKHVFSLLSPNH